MGSASRATMSRPCPYSPTTSRVASSRESTLMSSQTRYGRAFKRSCHNGAQTAKRKLVAHLPSQEVDEKAPMCRNSYTVSSDHHQRESRGQSWRANREFAP